MSATGWVRAFAPAKINLHLEVLGRRPDGFHEIRTWMMAVEPCDIVAVRATRDARIRLSITGAQASPDIRADETNLVWRAARELLDHGRSSGRVDGASGLELALTKNIPSCAGLGGASSDATATWIAAQAALGLEVPPADTQAALERLGSDCEFFFKTGRTGFGLCEGRGERVRQEDSPPSSWSVAILTPGVSAPTAQVYAALRIRLSPEPELHTLLPAWTGLPAAAARKFLFNRLEEVALEAIPGLRPWRELLDACGAEHFRLTGSGSSFFGLFDDRGEAGEVLERVSGMALARRLALRGSWVSGPRGHGIHLAQER